MIKLLLHAHLRLKTLSSIDNEMDKLKKPSTQRCSTSSSAFCPILLITFFVIKYLKNDL